MGNRTELSFLSVPRLFGVNEARDTRAAGRVALRVVITGMVGALTCAGKDIVVAVAIDCVDLKSKEAPRLLW